MDKEELQDKYFQWAKDTGRAEYVSTNVFVSHGNEIVKEQRMAWVVKTSPFDYKLFCDEYNLEYEQIALFYIKEPFQLTI